MTLDPRRVNHLILAVAVVVLGVVVAAGCDTGPAPAPTKPAAAAEPTKAAAPAAAAPTSAAPAAAAPTQAAAPAATAPAAKVSEVRIGLVMPLTGSVASVGLQGKAGAEVAIEEINGKGGIKSLGGAKLTLVAADSQGKPEVGATETERLALKENVAAIIGSYQSAVTFPATEVAERYKVPWVVQSAVKDEITERGFKYIFRPCNTSIYDVREMFDAITLLNKEFNVKGPATVGLLYEGTDWGRSVQVAAAKLVDKYNMKIVMDESYTQGMSSFQSQILKVKAANPDILIVAMYEPDHILFNKGYMENRLDLPYGLFAAGSGSESPTFYKSIDPKAVAYMFVQEDWDLAGPDKTPWIADVAKRFIAKTNLDSLSAYGAQGYSNVHIIADALERAGSADRDKVRDALVKTDISSGPALITGYQRIKFDETGQNTFSHGVISENLDGKRLPVWPMENRIPNTKPVWPVPKWADRK